MHIRSRRRTARSGMTLVEMSLASLLIVGVSAVVVQFTDSSWKAYGSLNRSEEVNQRAWRGIEQVTRKLRAAGAATNMLGGMWLDEVQFRSCQGFEDGEAVMGDLEKLSFRASADDPLDGVDNDGDGLVDEGEVVWHPHWATAAGDLRVLCRQVVRAPGGELPGNGVDDDGNGLVDEPGFGVRRVGDRLDLVLTVGERLASGQVIERTMRRSLAIHMEVAGGGQSETGQGY